LFKKHGKKKSVGTKTSCDEAQKRGRGKEKGGEREGGGFSPIQLFDMWNQQKKGRPDWVAKGKGNKGGGV